MQRRRSLPSQKHHVNTGERPGRQVQVQRETREVRKLEGSQRREQVRMASGALPARHQATTRMHPGTPGVAGAPTPRLALSPPGRAPTCHP